MNREQIIQMAREAGIEDWWDSGNEHREVLQKHLEAFAKLVAEHERNRTWTQAHWTEYERAIVAQEREACAKVCESIDMEVFGVLPVRAVMIANHCATAIRARGQA